MSEWDEELEERLRRQQLAAQMGGEERVARQHSNGRLTVRERVAHLLDDGSFREIGALTGSATYDDAGNLKDFVPTNFVTGEGRIDGRRVVVAGDDFTVRGGAADASIHEKQTYAERMAGEMGMPLVRLIDGTGGGGSVKSLEDYGRTYVPQNPGWDEVVANLARIPVVALALGPVAGLGAARLVTAHVAIGVRGIAQVFVAGPAVVEAGMGESVDKEGLGGIDVVARAGTVDLVVDTEDEAFGLTRRVLSYLPANTGLLPPRLDPTDEVDRRSEALRDAIPRDRRAPYDIRGVLAEVVDRDSVLELGRMFGRSTVTALARLDGFPVAVVASDPRFYGAGMTADGADKMTRFVDLAETFRLPVVHLVDQPGFLIGTAAERAGTIRHGARTLAAVYQSTVPWASVLIRRVFGVAGAAHRPHSRHTFRVAWPSGDWGSLPIEGGLEVAFKRMLAEAGEEAERLKAEIADRLEAVRSPYRTAEKFLVEDVIDPADTRPLLTDWVHSAYDVLAAAPPRTVVPLPRP